MRVLSCNRNTRWRARDSVSLRPRYYEITCAISGKLRGIQAIKAILERFLIGDFLVGDPPPVIISV